MQVLIISDFLMHPINGIEFVNELRRLSDVPVIMITGFLSDIFENYMLIDNIFFLHKPFDFEQIKYYIKCALEIKNIRII